MSDTIIGRFTNRRDADLAVEHLVQEHGLERADIFVEPEEAGNSAGEVKAGADAESGHPGVAPEGEPVLDGAIIVSVDVNDEKGELVRSALTQTGGEVVPH